MDSPFFSTYWTQPSQTRYSPSVVGGIPVQRKPATATSSPKVVSIPVHFVGSDTARSKAALKIQKLFRGFLVRKYVKQIASIRKEVDEIERRISEKETVELIRREPKERLRINETLMASLFKLDSVRGVDFGVRDFRKAVIKKAIALQEKVDAVAVNDDSDRAIAEADQVPKITESAMFSMNFDDGADPKGESRGEFVNHSVNDSTEYSVENSVDCCITSSDQTIETEDLENLGKVEETGDLENLGKAEETGDLDMDDEDPHCDVKEIVGNCISSPDIFLGCSEEGGETSPFTENWSELSVDNNHQSSTEGGGIVHQDGQQQRIEEEKSAAGESKGNKAIVERMGEDNEKMMRMMNELMERNEMQTRMLTSLTQRIGQLEKALLCDKLRKTKKKRQTM